MQGTRLTLTQRPRLDAWHTVRTDQENSCARWFSAEAPSSTRLGWAVLLVVLIGVLLVATFGMPGRAAAATDVSVRHSCTRVTPGHARCLAEVLVSPTTHRPIHPHPRIVPQPSLAAGAAFAAQEGEGRGVAAPTQQSPAYLQQAYDLTYLSATHGHGDTIAIIVVGNDPELGSDLDHFRKSFGLRACTTAGGCLRVLNQQGSSAPLPGTSWAWAQETSLDIDAASSLCPNCRLMVVEANSSSVYDLGDAISVAADNGADQISNSWSEDSGPNPYPHFNYPGVSVLAATGDNGVVPSGESAFPAALSTVTAVGGTSLKPAPKNAPTTRGFTETPWSDSGAGCDTNEAVLPYQPQTGCRGRSYADVSADANPATGLMFYDRQAGGWLDGGGTSLATPLVAAFEAVTHVNGTSPAWAYTDRIKLNSAGVRGASACAASLSVLCNPAAGYSGATGVGSISGDVTTGAPGICAPAFGPAGNKTYVVRRGSQGVALKAGIYSNGERTTYYWEYGTSAAYTARTRPRTLAGGVGAQMVSSVLGGLAAGQTYHLRLVASNATGTSYGYDYRVKTARG
jgi:hypothetical protein